MTVSSWLTSLTCVTPVVLDKAAMGARGLVDELWGCQEHTPGGVSGGVAGELTPRDRTGAVLVGTVAVFESLARLLMPRAGGLRLTRSEQDGEHECLAGVQEGLGNSAGTPSEARVVQRAHTQGDELGGGSSLALDGLGEPMCLPCPLYLHSQLWAPAAQAGPCAHTPSLPAKSPGNRRGEGTTLPFATPGWGQVLTGFCVFSVLGREGGMARRTGFSLFPRARLWRGGIHTEAGFLWKG